MLARMLIMSTALLASDAAAMPVKDDSGARRPNTVQRRDAKRAPSKAATSSRPRTRKIRGKKRKQSNLAVNGMRIVIEEADFVDMAFEDFAEWLGRRTGANVVVRWGQLENHGIERDATINLKARNVSIQKLLPLVFSQLTEEPPPALVAAKADGNTLMISTRSDIRTKRVTRVYEISDLLMIVPNFRASTTPYGHPRTRLSSRANPVAKGLMKSIIRHIQPQSWKTNGGKGTVRVYKGRLVVYNNLEVHQALGGITPSAKAPPSRKNRRKS